MRFLLAALLLVVHADAATKAEQKTAQSILNSLSLRERIGQLIFGVAYGDAPAANSKDGQRFRHWVNRGSAATTGSTSAGSTATAPSPLFWRYCEIITAAACGSSLALVQGGFGRSSSSKRALKASCTRDATAPTRRGKS